ncbi:hypothetical protein JVT61DRAFT_4268 [Boletus reticuloceps]|uniref:Uncharacterized protein n=1 Tax=Boletus reticuloceps TaxID=495285 RepID=A0A8I3A8S1_9AGAM|nr:hypothetical protein JVT61DRAFT_4268 [Boletus reticuloceps]
MQAVTHNPLTDPPDVPVPSNPPNPAPAQEELGPRIRCPPRRYLQGTEDPAAELSPTKELLPMAPTATRAFQPMVPTPGHIRLEACRPTPRCQNPAPSGPGVPAAPQDLEFINIDAGLSEDSDDDDELLIPCARAPHEGALNTSRTTTSTSINDPTDPMELTPSHGWALDIHHFFEKRAKEALICHLCKNLKEQDPTNFPEGRKYIFSPNTGNSGLRLHLERFHLLEFLELAKKNNWPIFVQSVNLAFSLGYTLTTLHEALQKPALGQKTLPP